jgi:hypothetical protein
LLEWQSSKYGLPVRVTLKVTPQSQPERVLENTVTVSITETGRSWLWDRYEVMSRPPHVGDV